MTRGDRRILRMPRDRRGFTLLELLVGIFIALFLTAAAVALARHETRLMGVSNEQLELEQSSRSALDLLAFDLRQAGVGVGYDNADQFHGLLLESFTAGGVTWNDDAASASIQLQKSSPSGGPLGPTYDMPTEDIGIMITEGAFATIADYSDVGGGQYCLSEGVRFEPGEVVVFRSEDGLAARSTVIQPTGAETCRFGDCVGGCMSFTWSIQPTPAFLSDPSAQTASYLGGEIHGDLKTIVWFVESTDPASLNRGQLRRAMFDGNPANDCTARDSSCGAIVSDNTETLQIEVWSWDPTLATWQRVTGANRIVGRERVRVDVELVVRSRVPGVRKHEPVTLALAPGQCVPEPCATSRDDWDQIERRAYRTSIEVKNSGRFALGR